MSQCLVRRQQCDGVHAYTYDAEGNILTVDGGSNGSYVYDALNPRVLVQTCAATYEYLFDYAGPRTSSWLSPLTDNPGTDAVMGLWSYGYDDLNRLTSATASPAVNQDSYFCWSYDNFGNRTSQIGSNETISGGGSALCQQQSNSAFSSAWATYSASGNSNSNTNRMTSTPQAPGGPVYDAGGNVTNDGANQYLYNGDGQICAVMTVVNGTTFMTGYLYDAAGQRVAKGTLTSMSCNPNANGFTATNRYVIGPSGEQLTEFDGSGNWKHTNVVANGALIATYDINGLHFQLNDWLGSRRVQTNYAGTTEFSYPSLPFGDALAAIPNPDCLTVNNCYSEDSTEHHFTGKERDTESGNDYFGARYYASNMGRFMSPDWAEKPEDVPYADLDNPQSLNLYSYVNNNPLSKADKDGHCAEDFCVVEGSVTAYFAGAAVLAGASAYLSTPAGQRSLDTFTSAAGASFSSSFHSLSRLSGYFRWNNLLIICSHPPGTQLPAGLSLNASTGAITGTPTTAGWPIQACSWLEWGRFCLGLSGAPYEKYSFACLPD